MGKWVFGILFGGVAAFFMIAGTVMAYKQDALIKNAVPTKATVTSSEVVSSTSHSSKGQKRTRYTAKISYEYSVSGRRHTSTEINPGGMNVSEESAQNLTFRYPTNKTVDAFYDRRDPNTSFLIKHRDFGPYMFILFPMIHLSIGVMGLLSSSNRSKAPIARGNGKWELPGGVPIATKSSNSLLLAAIWWGVGGLAIAHYFSVADKPYDSFAVWASGIYFAIGIVPLWAALHYLSLKHKFSDATVTTDHHPAQRGQPLKLNVSLPLAGGGSIESATATLVCKATVRTSSGGKTRTSTSDIWKADQPFTRAQDIMSDRTLSGDVVFTPPGEQPPSTPPGQSGYPRHEWEIRLHVKRAGPDYKARFPVQLV